jgi:hypothetical protein
LSSVSSGDAPPPANVSPVVGLQIGLFQANAGDAKATAAMAAKPGSKYFGEIFKVVLIQTATGLRPWLYAWTLNESHVLATSALVEKRLTANAPLNRIRTPDACPIPT